MDPTYNGFPGYIANIGSNPMLPNSYQFSENPNQYQFNQLSTDFDFLSHQFTVPPEPGDLVPPVVRSTTVNPEAKSVSYDDETVFKFLNQMLMEDENIEPDDIKSYDPLAFRVTERSFYEILGQPYPVTPETWQFQQSKQPVFVDQPNQQQLLYDYQDSENPDGFLSRSSSSDVNASSCPSTRPINLADSQGLTNYGEQKLYISQTALPSDNVYNINSHSGSGSGSNLQLSVSSFGDGILESSVNQFLDQNKFTNSDYVLQFQKGLEEASKFLPEVNLLETDMKSSRMSREVKGHVPNNTAKKDMSEMMNLSNRRRERRNSPNGLAEREDAEPDDLRLSKQSAIYKEVQEEEDELSELFDKVLLFKLDDTSGLFGENMDVQIEKSKSSPENGQPRASNGGGEKARANKQRKKKEAVDLRNLLILCAQAVSTNDFRTSTELLKKIRQHCSPFGDGSERSAYCFANGLEARMTGDVIRPQIRYNAVGSKLTAIEKLKGFQLLLSSFPINNVSIFFMNKMIMEMAENATTLHIVDFGIMYGYQWPILIHKLSKRHGGPPKLRITGIDIPQDGFRPTEWIEETGRRLANYCARFRVPFEFNAIASQHWESIKVEDLKVEMNEMLVVNCLFRFKNLMNETNEENCPRDSVLKLIRSLKPDIFVHSILNGGYNSPFFLPRFREALFYYSAIFDSFDVTMPDSPERFHFETNLLSVEAMNVIACEGADRNERPETYKQWQVRTQRAGLKMLPLDPEITKLYRDMYKEKYHKDFKVDQAGDWLLQGWKGRVIAASSCWVPA